MFEGALLSSDNVRLAFLRMNTHGLTESVLRPGLVEILSVPVGFDAHHRPAKVFRLLRSETENTAFPRTHPTRVFRIAVICVICADTWVFGLDRVRDEAYVLTLGMITNFVAYSGFFSGTMALLRRLPFIGTFLVDPYVQGVTAAFEASFSTRHRFCTTACCITVARSFIHGIELTGLSHNYS